MSSARNSNCNWNHFFLKVLSNKTSYFHSELKQALQLFFILDTICIVSVERIVRQNRTPSHAMPVNYIILNLEMLRSSPKHSAIQKCSACVCLPLWQKKNMHCFKGYLLCMNIFILFIIFAYNRVCNTHKHTFR